eukprot:TRINITY_DN3675_c0_g1_i1.p2 TRINITY_DN3675_c0_g1~~TRINITY_DN3675_c0_g1_i1.p2  ORF type:complete len:330 (+),score=98.54 TRINITY_DN3675_c0_g1_i1:195-1184(+)
MCIRDRVAAGQEALEDSAAREAAMETQLEELRHAAQASEARVSQLEESLADCERERSQGQRQLKTLTKELETAGESLQRAGGIEGIEETAAALEEAQVARRQVEAKNKRVVRELDKAKAMLVEKEGALDDLGDALRDAEAASSRLQDETAGLRRVEAEATELRDELNRLGAVEEEADQLREQLGELMGLRAEVARLTTLSETASNTAAGELEREREHVARLTGELAEHEAAAVAGHSECRECTRLRGELEIDSEALVIIRGELENERDAKKALIRTVAEQAQELQDLAALEQPVVPESTKCKQLRVQVAELKAALDKAVRWIKMASSTP